MIPHFLCYNRRMAWKQTLLRGIEPFIRIPVAGLDISDRSVKYLKFRSSRTPQLELAEELEIPEGVVEKGEIKQEDLLARLLGAWRQRQSYAVRSSFVVASLPEEKSFLRLVQLPRVKPEELGKLVRWEVESNIPLPAEELIYDQEGIEPLQDHLDHTDVVLTAFPRDLVGSYVRVLARAGFRALALELESQAIVRALVPNLRLTSSQVIVDMGSSRTSFIIVSGGAIVFTTTLELGGRTLEENIAKAVGADQERARVLKKDVGLDRAAAEREEVFGALVPAIGALADELKRSVEYYESHATHRHGASTRIEQVLLTGGDANLYGLDTYLASSLQVPVRRADPFAVWRDRWGAVLPPIQRSRAVAFTTAIGLALRGI